MQSWTSPDISDKLIFQENLDKQLKIFNSKSQKIEPIVRKKQPIKIYVCGITPYDSAHLGHAFTYITFDSIIRVLNCIGQKTIYAQNVTDLDDPLFEKARTLNVNWRDIVQEQVQVFRDDMKVLNVIPPDFFIGVEENIDLIIKEIESIDRFSYHLEDNLYFQKDGKKNSTLVKDIENSQLVEIASERGCDVGTKGKQNPLDPILWRKSRDDEPKWSTSFGDGRPGWHIQCISLAQNYLNLPFDIQGGGKDLIYPHHSMCDEITTRTKNKDFANYYFHVGMVGYQGSKMSKSKGNLVFVHELVKQGINPSVIRLMLISKKWNSDWEFDNEELNIFQDLLDKLSTYKNKYITFSDFNQILDHLLQDLDFANAINSIIKADKHDQDKDLVSLSNIMNDLLGLSI